MIGFDLGGHVETHEDYHKEVQDALKAGTIKYTKTKCFRLPWAYEFLHKNEPLYEEDLTFDYPFENQNGIKAHVIIRDWFWQRRFLLGSTLR